MVDTVELFSDIVFPRRQEAVVPVNGFLTVDPCSPSIVEIVTSGRGAQDQVTIGWPPIDDNGVNLDYIGARVTVSLKTLTAGGDSVKLSNNGSFTFKANRSTSAVKPSRLTATALVLDFVGAYISLIWSGDRWVFDANSSLQGDYATITWQDVAEVLQPPNGYAVQLNSPTGVVTVHGGSSDALRYQFDNLPTDVPGSPGFLYKDGSGFVKVTS